MPRNNPLAYLSGQFNQQAKRDRTVGTEVEDEFLDRARSFDADEAARMSARAQFDEFREDLADDMAALRGRQVGAGRLDSGFGFEDEDELVEASLDRLGRTLAQNSLRSAELQQRNTAELGRFGQATTGRALDVMASERDTELTLEEMRRRDEAARRGSKFGFLGKVGGALLGPAGGGVVGKIADGLESLL